MEKQFKREIGSLDDIFDFIDGFIAGNGIGADAAFSLRLVIEELFTNLVRHNVGGRGYITINLDRTGNRLTMHLEDYDVEPFAPRQKTIDVHAPLAERPVGGLGIHLVKSIVDTLTYDYKDGTLSVTAVKTMEDEDV
jgi:anti-sigma regulatory factor (Ser/Thr protein kinase)